MIHSEDLESLSDAADKLEEQSATLSAVLQGKPDYMLKDILASILMSVRDVDATLFRIWRKLY